MCLTRGADMPRAGGRGWAGRGGDGHSCRVALLRELLGRGVTEQDGSRNLLPMTLRGTLVLATYTATAPSLHPPANRRLRLCSAPTVQILRK